MERADFERLSTEDLWALHVMITEILEQRIRQEKLLLEERLRQLRDR